MAVPDDDALLTRAFALAAEARAAGDHPFGALLAVDGGVVAEARNGVSTDADITSHAETALVRVLERSGRLGLLATGTVFASCEPCPMCVGALFWAGARRVVFGLSSARLSVLASAAGGTAPHFTITAAQIGAAASPPMTLIGPLREDEAAVAHLGFW